MNLLRPSRTLMLSVALALASCATTEIADSWVDPRLTSLPHFEKVFVAYLGGDDAAQRTAEDTMASRLERSTALKCYEHFPDVRVINPSAIRDELRAAGCDGAVIMHLTRVEQELSYSSGVYPSYYASFGGYWGHAYAPTEVRTDEIVHVVTNVYSLVDDKLLYSARSETFNPRSTRALVEEIAEVLMADLEEKGLR